METEAFALAFINMVQVIALAYIGARQAQVKRDLNGARDEQREAVEQLRLELQSQPRA